MEGDSVAVRIRFSDEGSSSIAASCVLSGASVTGVWGRREGGLVGGFGFSFQLETSALRPRR